LTGWNATHYDEMRIIMIRLNIIQMTN